MFHYIEDKEFLSDMRKCCGNIMQDTCHILKEDFDIGAVCYLVGSGAKNLITQNADRPVDLDYNLKIVRCGNWDDCRYLKECVRKAFNKALNMKGLPDCEDSTSSLTTKQRVLNSGNKTSFSIDVCIVRECDGYVHRLIHEKTGWIFSDKYYWNQAPNSKNIRKKADVIKKQGKWLLVRKQYLKLKNTYLSQNDRNHPSFICYVEAVHNVYEMRNRH